MQRFDARIDLAARASLTLALALSAAGCTCEGERDCGEFVVARQNARRSGDLAYERCLSGGESECRAQIALTGGANALLYESWVAMCQAETSDASVPDGGNPRGDAGSASDGSAPPEVARLRVGAMGGGELYVRLDPTAEGEVTSTERLLELPRGTVVRLSALPGDPAANFVRWSGDVPGCEGTSSSISIPAATGSCFALFEPRTSPCEGVTSLDPPFLEFYAVDPDTLEETGLIGTMGLRVGQDLRAVVMNAVDFPVGDFELVASVPPSWTDTRVGSSETLATSASGVSACSTVTVTVTARDCGLIETSLYSLRVEPATGSCP
jgi:hypothetical protein